MMLRRIAEILLARIVVRRRLSATMGSGIVVASVNAGGLRYLFRRSTDIDPVLFSVAKAIVRERDVIWDVGANVGLFAAMASGLAKREGVVLAFEADIDTFHYLRATSAAQPRGHAAIEPICVAVSRAAGIARFNIARRSRSANSIVGFGSTQTGGVLLTTTVPTLSLDFLLDHFPRPNVVKIDVEGAEFEVLQGAKRMLSEVRPRLIIEVAGEHSSSVEAILRNSDYRVFDGSTMTEISPGSGAPWDTVAIAAEQSLPGLTS